MANTKSEPPANEASIRLGDRVVGSVVGALLGAILRGTVAYWFVYLAHDGTGFFKDDPGEAGGWSTVLSTVIGLLVGGIGGATCHPIRGAIISASLSALSCFGLVVAPLGFCFFVIGQVDRMETLELIGGLVVMTIAGGIAGGAGSAVGRRSRKWL